MTWFRRLKSRKLTLDAIDRRDPITILICNTNKAMVLLEYNILTH